MAVEIGTLVLKGRFGTGRGDDVAQREELERALEALRYDLLREVEDRLERGQRSPWER